MRRPAWSPEWRRTTSRSDEECYVEGMETMETFGRFKRLLAAATLFPAFAFATDCRFTLADQSNWSANTGFYMDLENIPTGSSTYCQLSNMTIAVGVANGAQWQIGRAHV